VFAYWRIARWRHHLPQRDPRAHAVRNHRGKGRHGKVLAGVIEANAKTRKDYEALISAPEERALYNEWLRQWELYKKGTEEVLALSRKTPANFPTRRMS